MSQYAKINNITGWVVFAISLLVYAVTAEPTVSFWDCGEFISSADKLEVVHPPGSPLFAMLGRIFILFAPDISSKAFMINLFSGLSSAFTVLFLFWVITALTRKLFERMNQEIDNTRLIVTMGAGVVGAMTATFLDSFWFSAVEGEVYAVSAFFTLIILWAMIKWEQVADEPYADRWIVFIGLMIGLGVGVHLLHLLAIPTLAFIYYFRKFKPNLKGSIYTFLIGLGILGFVMWGILDYLVRFSAKFDLIFVNNMGLPFGSGVLFFALLGIGAMIWIIRFAMKKRISWLPVAMLSVIMVIIGFSSYAMVLIRANVNPAINMNVPSDIHTLHSYLKREQYGSRPLLYGPSFAAQPIRSKEVGVRYARGEDKYIEAGKKTKYVFKVDNTLRDIIRSNYPNYSNAQINQIMGQYEQMNKMMLFPRLGSIVNADHERQYRAWLGLGENEFPDFGDNLRFFFKYQIGYMYLRYFLWNFSGRQDDMQGHIDRGRANGNWITGIGPIDNALVGRNLDLADSKNSKARNKFYMLPLILGLVGMFYHFKKDKKGAIIILMFFLFTGLMNIINSNQPPSEPRERDYAVALSFCAFAMWVGIGVVPIFENLRKKMNLRNSALAASVGCMVVPLILVIQGWDDHDRSDIYLARDSAINYLQSCDSNAVLFTQGDNDTYPLWYVQEVENFRKDVRVVNLSLLAVDWYIDQLHNKVNLSEPVKIRFTKSDYLGDGLMQTPVEENRNYVQRYGSDLSTALDFVKDPGTNKRFEGYEDAKPYLPAKNFSIPVDSNKVMQNGSVPDKYKNRLVKELKLRVNRGQLIRDELMILDIIASNNWERPIYFSITVDSRKHMGLSRYLQREGLAYRLVPVDIAPGSQQGNEFTNTDIMRKNILEKWKFGGLKKPGIHLNETALRTAKMLRGNLIYLGQVLYSEQKNEEAIEMLNMALEEMPEYNVPFTEPDELYPLVNTLFLLEESDRAGEMGKHLAELLESDLRYQMGSADMKRVRASAGGGRDFLFAISGKPAEQLPYTARMALRDVTLFNNLIDQCKTQGSIETARALRDQLVDLESELNVALLNDVLKEF